TSTTSTAPVPSVGASSSCGPDRAPLTTPRPDSSTKETRSTSCAKRAGKRCRSQAGEPRACGTNSRMLPGSRTSTWTRPTSTSSARRSRSAESYLSCDGKYEWRAGGGCRSARRPDEAIDQILTQPEVGSSSSTGFGRKPMTATRVTVRGTPRTLPHAYLAPGEGVLSLTRRHPVALASTFVAWFGVVMVAFAIGLSYNGATEQTELSCEAAAIILSATLFLGWRI